MKRVFRHTKPFFSLFLLGFFFYGSHAMAEMSAEGLARAKKIYTKICLQCHAKAGAGKARLSKKTGKLMVNAMMGPQIAGLSEAYITEQMKAIRSGLRKTTSTISMKQKISKLTDAEIALMAVYLSKEINPQVKPHKGMLETP